MEALEKEIKEIIDAETNDDSLGEAYKTKDQVKDDVAQLLDSMKRDELVTAYDKLSPAEEEEETTSVQEEEDDDEEVSETDDNEDELDEAKLKEAYDDVKDSDDEEEVDETDDSEEDEEGISLIPFGVEQHDRPPFCRCDRYL